MIFQQYEKISLSNECAEVISTNLEKVKIFLFYKGFPSSISKALQQWKYKTYSIHLQSSKKTDPLWDQMPFYFSQ